MTTSPLARFTATIAAVAATLALAACGSAQPGAHPGPSPTTTTAATAIEAPASLNTGEVARPSSAVPIFASPTATESTMTLPATTTFGSARALLVTGRTEGWLQVLLPTRPNGSTGWMHATGVTVRPVSLEVRVDLSERSLDVLDGGTSVLHTAVAVGTPAAPTPTGRFSLVDKLDTGASGSAYGPFALGLSAHSDVLTEFGGGDGQIGIHGTNDPSSIGQAASHGCIRVPNDVVVRLAGALPLGTPVLVVE